MSTDKIPYEWLSAYIDGTATPDQIKSINEELESNPEAYGEFLLASRAAYLGEGETEDDSDFNTMNIAAGTAAVVTGGAGLADYLLHGQREMEMVASNNNSISDDRIDDTDDSIIQKTNNSFMENASNYQENSVQQQYNDSCAIKSQQLILNDFGVPISEDQLISQAEQLNIYTPGSGTAPHDVGKLLELNGVRCTQYENATIYDLTGALARGQKVVIGVDSSELWNKDVFAPVMNKISDSLIGENADHALIVAGIDTTDPDNVQVILTDPGTGEEAARYPMGQFLDAWQDSGNFMVTTDSPAPLAYNPEMVGFDYSAGHLPMIGAMPFDYFDQTVLPLSHELLEYPTTLELLDNDFDSMVGGEINSLSPELVHALSQIPDFDTSILGTDMFSHDGVSFGSSNMADYYKDWSEHHAKLAQDDIEHGNIDSAQNHLRYSDDYHNRSMDELEDID